MQPNEPLRARTVTVDVTPSNKLLMSCWCHSSLLCLSLSTVSPVVIISADVLYGLHGDTLNITATIHSTSQVSSIQWSWNETLLNPASDDRYSVTSDSSQSVLSIHSFEEGLVGRYEIVVSNMEGQNSSDGVSVLFAGEGGRGMEKGGEE